MSAAFESMQAPRRTLAGATILQIVPRLTEAPDTRAAVEVARTLLRAGARALIAAEEGPLAAELRSFGAEWIPLANATVNPLKLRRNVRAIEQIVSSERVDILHAQSAGAAWSGRIAAARVAVWLVTSVPDVPPSVRGLSGLYTGALAQGDRIIAPSIFAATPLMQSYGISPDQITIIPRAVDTATFDPAAAKPHRVAAMLNAWQTSPDDRVVVVPGRVAPWNGQILVPEIARMLLDAGARDVVFVLAGETTTHGKYVRAVLKQAEALGVDNMFRVAGHCADMPAVFSAAEIVLVPAIEAPVLGRVVAQAQAMARPVVTSDIGCLPEHVVVPPRLPEELRTGWVAKSGDAVDFAHALGLALSLDPAAYRAMAARARQFAEYMFAPQSVAEATRAVYSTLLARDS
jgi:glycosyltransferase involved in cell wall biosynthesis